MGVCAKPGPATVRGTRKVFFLLLTSFLVTTTGLAAVLLVSNPASVAFAASWGLAASSALNKQDKGSQWAEQILRRRLFVSHTSFSCHESVKRSPCQQSLRVCMSAFLTVIALSYIMEYDTSSQ